ncbi:DUF2147 domain-containing protein [Ornithobacterium rhinotracheale]
MKRILLLLFISLSGFIMAQSPVGTWKTIDDNTGKARSFVKIYEKNGELFGKIVKITNPALQDKRCEKCKGDKKNKPLLGFEVITGLKKNGNIWEDGKITDPDSGKEYSCKIELDGKDKLKVRGFLGFSLLGRTQVWERVN